MPVFHLTRLSSLRAFGHRDFAHVWMGSLISNIGSWMATIAVGVYVTQVTGRAEWTGGVAALTYLPAVVLAPVGGALADRFDRRAYAAVGTLVQSLLAGILTWLAFTGRLTVPAVAAISFLNGCANTLVNPAFSALIADVVPAEELHSAFSLNSAQFNLGRIIGPALAVAVFAAGGMAWALLLNTVSFLAVLVALARMRPATRPRPAGGGLWAGITRGTQVARQDLGIRMALTRTFLVAVLVTPFIGLVPVFAIQVLRQGAAATSLLVTAHGLGAVTAALMAGVLVQRLGRKRLQERVLRLLGVVAGLYWLSPALPFAAGVIYCLGATYMLTLTGLNTLCQTLAPPELRARVSSLYSMVLSVGYALGVWLQGALADRVGVRPVTVSAALLFLSLMLLLGSRGLEGLEATSPGKR